MLLVLSCCCLCAIYWSHVLSWECRCSWSSADRRCSNYIWVINKYIAYWGGSNIRDLTVHPLEVAFTKWVEIIWNPLKRNNQIINSSPMVYPVLASKTYIWLTYNTKSFQLTEMFGHFSTCQISNRIEHIPLDQWRLHSYQTQPIKIVALHVFIIFNCEAQVRFLRRIHLLCDIGP